MTDKGSPADTDRWRPLSRHAPIRTWRDRAAWALARAMVFLADRLFSGRYGHRAVVLETIAAVPGMVAAMLLHLHSLRSLQNDYGWIHALLAEAENERMHLMTVAEIAQPVWWERGFILLAQGGFFGGYLLLYIVAPALAHRMVGYLEEQAVISYTDYLADLESHGTGRQAAPAVAIEYWHLSPDATLQEVIAVIRKDECRHRDVNHSLSDQLSSGRKRELDREVDPDVNEGGRYNQ